MIADKAQEGSIFIDPTRPDTLLRAEVEALRAICEEPLRVFRRAMHLDGPGWKPMGDGRVYQLLAVGRRVWRCIGREEREGFVVGEIAYEELEGGLLDKAGVSSGPEVEGLAIMTDRVCSICGSENDNVGIGYQRLMKN